MELEHDEISNTLLKHEIRLSDTFKNTDDYEEVFMAV